MYKKPKKKITKNKIYLTNTRTEYKKHAMEERLRMRLQLWKTKPQVQSQRGKNLLDA